MRCSVVAVGTELLLGQIVDTNSSWIGEQLAANGIDSLLSILQMPAGIPVGTLAIGRAGAENAGLLAASILAHHHPHIRAALQAERAARTNSVL